MTSFFINLKRTVEYNELDNKNQLLFQINNITLIKVSKLKGE